jgi:hypothetical protein
MITTIQQPVAMACLFTWTGFICAISFMEAWLKFRAPGVTLPIGLGIGRLVFGALNKVEWVFTAIVCISATVYSRHFFTMSNICLLIVILILAIKTIWLLPALDARAELYIQNKPVPGSNLHFWFVGSEFIKAIGLLTMAISHFKQS